MPDNWSFVAAAYGLTALVLGLYWRRLVRKERELSSERSRTPSRTGHPRPKQDTKSSLPESQ